MTLYRANSYPLAHGCAFIICDDEVPTLIEARDEDASLGLNFLSGAHVTQLGPDVAGLIENVNFECFTASPSKLHAPELRAPREGNDNDHERGSLSVAAAVAACSPSETCPSKRASSGIIHKSPFFTFQLEATDTLDDETRPLQPQPSIGDAAPRAQDVALRGSYGLTLSRGWPESSRNELPAAPADPASVSAATGLLPECGSVTALTGGDVNSSPPVKRAACNLGQHPQEPHPQQLKPLCRQRATPTSSSVCRNTHNGAGDETEYGGDQAAPAGVDMETEEEVGTTGYPSCVRKAKPHAPSGFLPAAAPACTTTTTAADDQMSFAVEEGDGDVDEHGEEEDMQSVLVHVWSPTAPASYCDGQKDRRCEPHCYGGGFVVLVDNKMIRLVNEMTQQEEAAKKLLEGGVPVPPGTTQPRGAVAVLAAKGEQHAEAALMEAFAEVDPGARARSRNAATGPCSRNSEGRIRAPAAASAAPAAQLAPRLKRARRAAAEAVAAAARDDLIGEVEEEEEGEEDAVLAAGDDEDDEDFVLQCGRGAAGAKRARTGGAAVKGRSTPKVATGNVCRECGADRTPQWREGPQGPRTLCNACGVRYKKKKMLGEGRKRK